MQFPRWKSGIMGLQSRQKTALYWSKGLEGHANGNWCCAVAYLYILIYTVVQTHERCTQMTTHQYTLTLTRTDWDLRICCLWNVCISQWETGGGAAVAMTTAISLPYGGGGGRQASNNAYERWMETSAVLADGLNLPQGTFTYTNLRII